MSKQENTKPLCSVKGMPIRGAICGHVIVGMKYCGFSGECQHKTTNNQAPENSKK